MTEIWKDVVGYDGVYQVSNLGRVRSHYSKNGEIVNDYTLLNGKKDKDGYREVRLCKNGTVKYKRVHRLVAETFLDGDSKLQVNHIDGDKSNNIVSNLEFVTPKENVCHAHKIGLHNGCVTKVRMSKNGKEVEFCSITEAAEFLGVNRGWFRDHSKKEGNPFAYNGVTFLLLGGKCGDRVC